MSASNGGGSEWGLLFILTPLVMVWLGWVLDKVPHERLEIDMICFSPTALSRAAAIRFDKLSLNKTPRNFGGELTIDIAGCIGLGELKTVGDR